MMKKFLLVIILATASVILLIFLDLLLKPRLCGNNCQDSFKLQIENDSTAIFNRQKIVPPSIPQPEEEPEVLGSESAIDEKRIYINLTTQTLSAYQGKTLFLKTLISSGLWGRTPTGDFTIWTKFRSTRMTGGQGADYYDLPNVPYAMFFSNNQVPASAGFSLHGTYWHNNFGHRMSHGCVNLKTTDAAKLYNWVDKLGVKITIYEEVI